MGEGTVKFGKFELLRQIARGGMAQIFLAIERGPNDVNRQLVVKRILPEMNLSEDFVTMFTDEARLVSRLAHPNIAHVYGFGEIHGVHYLSLEYVDGVTLDRLFRKLEPDRIPIEITLRILADVCAGLHYAHELKDDNGISLGVIHRDVSPQNIMISRTGTTKVIDFGLARAATQVYVTRARGIKGKLPYMAPELLTHEGLDRRADIFSAGVVLYEMATGTRFFPEQSQVAMANAILFENIEIVLPQGVPSRVHSIISRALEKNKDNRYASAEEMQLDLEELISEKPSRSTHYAVGQYINEWLEKNPLPKGVPASVVTSPLESSAEEMASQASDDSLNMALCDNIPTVTDMVVRPEESGSDPPELFTKPALISPLTSGTDIPNSRGSIAANWMAIGVCVVGVLALIPVFVLILPGVEKTESINTSANQPFDSILIPQVAPGIAAPPTECASANCTPEAPVDGGLDDDGDVAESSQRKRALPAPQGFGTLFLDTEPWSKVRIAGQSLGRTPVVNAKISAGRHRVRLRDANGNLHSRRVVITQGKATRVFFSLSPRNSDRALHPKVGVDTGLRLHR